MTDLVKKTVENLNSKSFMDLLKEELKKELDFRGYAPYLEELKFDGVGNEVVALYKTEDGKAQACWFPFDRELRYSNFPTQNFLIPLVYNEKAKAEEELRFERGIDV